MSAKQGKCSYETQNATALLERDACFIHGASLVLKKSVQLLFKAAMEGDEEGASIGLRVGFFQDGFECG